MSGQTVILHTIQGNLIGVGREGSRFVFQISQYLTWSVFTFFKKEFDMFEILVRWTWLAYVVILPHPPFDHHSTLVINNKFHQDKSISFNRYAFHQPSNKAKQTTNIRNNMGQKCEGNCRLWVLNEMVKKIYPENLKKNRGCPLGVTIPI